MRRADEVRGPRQTRRLPARRGFLHFGPAAAVIGVLAVASGVALLWWGREAQRERPDLVLVTFAKEHVEGHERAARKFREMTGKRVEIQLTDSRALNTRLQAALQSGAEVPDLVEIVEPNMGLFTRGPIDDVGFVDLTDKLRAEGWLEKLVPSRFSLWSSRGRTFALPHDVHPVMLAYRRDLVEAEGIDVSKLTTWEEFARVGRELVARHRRPDGNSDRYMIDLSAGGGGMFTTLMLQRGAEVLNEKGEVAFDSPAAAEVVLWYVRAVVGEGRIGFDAGWGQNLSQTMLDGLVLFYFCPDWRTRSYKMEVPGLSGKMALMPLPAWEPGGRRTSVWGGTGLAIPKAGRDPELAWKFATYLYYGAEYQESRFRSNHILPPLREAWSLPVMDEPDPYYSGQPRGRMFAELARETPPRHVSAFTALGESKAAEALVNSLAYFRANGENGLEAFVRAELKRTADQVRAQKARNVFLRTEDAADRGEK